MRISGDDAKNTTSVERASTKLSAAANLGRQPRFYWDIITAELATVAFALFVSSFPFVASEFVSAYAIPSRSMDQTLQIGDVVLAEKLSSILSLPLERGDLVFFSPPQELEDIVVGNGDILGRRDKFVKRVAAVAGDVVQVDEDGRGVRINDVPRALPPLACREPEPAPRAAPEEETRRSVEALLAAGKIDEREAAALLREVVPPARETAEGAIASLGIDGSASDRFGRRAQTFGNIEAREIDPQQIGSRLTVPEGTVFVLGDCEARSTDSRVWGPLPKSSVVARPVVRIWPPERVGAIDARPVLGDGSADPFRRELLRFRGALNDAVLPGWRL